MTTAPSGWITTPFTDVFDIQGGTQPPKSTFHYSPLPTFVRLLQIRDFGDRPVPTYIPNRPSLKLCSKDDILIGRYGASVGRICTGMDGAYNVALAKVIIPDAIDRRFVFWLLESPVFQQPILQVERSAQNGFNKNDLSAITVPLPPLAEQRRLVERLEDVISHVNLARHHLSSVPLILKHFRQAVLAVACSGRLTEDWRESHTNEESVASLRQRISTERTRAWESGQLAKHRKRRYPKPVLMGEEELPDVPETWTWVSADEVCSQITDGEHVQPRYKSVGLPMITATHVRDGFVEFKDVGLISEEDFRRCLDRCAPAKGDILIVSVGATTGRAAIVPECQPFAMVRSVLMLRPLIEPKFLLRWTQSRWCQTWISQASGASAQPHFYIHDNKRMPVPLPSTSEQREIVRRVDALFAVADTIEAYLSKAALRTDKLTQSILAKAFRGELVPTEAELARREGREYEPAAVLLERIKKEREAQTSSKQKRTRAQSARRVGHTL